MNNHIRKQLTTLGFCLTLLLTLSATARETLTVPIGKSHQPPLVIHEGEHLTGIYIELFKEVLRRADIDPVYVHVPKMRARIMFETGEVMLSCCDNPAWRKRPLEQSVQLFTNSFYHTRDVFIFPKGKRFVINNLSALSDKEIAVIRGYGYSGSEWFGEQIKLNNEEQLLQFISAGRADVGIVSEEILDYWEARNPERIDRDGTHDFATLHFRVHRDRADLLDPINKAIDDVINSGLRDEIVRQYISN